jgi:methenyltetrahydrofolate cyclohydrolase
MAYRALSLEAYCKELSSDQAVPGGGSAAALVGTVGVSLSLMVARVMAKKIAVQKRRKWKDIIHDLESVKRSIAAVIDRDPRLYKKVAAAYALSKKNARRSERVQTALLNAYLSMRDLAIDMCSGLRLSAEVALGARGAIANDVYVSKEFLRAGFYAAIETAQININYLSDDERIETCTAELKNIQKAFKKIKA